MKCGRINLICNKNIYSINQKEMDSGQWQRARALSFLACVFGPPVVLLMCAEQLSGSETFKIYVYMVVFRQNTRNHSRLTH